MKFLSVILFVSFSIILNSCDFIYSPKQEPYPGGGGSKITKDGILYAINPGQQTCNPSISHNNSVYPACMLWLGFKILKLRIPAKWLSEYDTVSVQQHDRLTITDTSNTVQWYVKREKLSIAGHIQDPEWSTHPDYIVCLGEDSLGNWGGYAVRVIDAPANPAYLKFCKTGLADESTPHVWLPDSATNGGIVLDPQYDPLTNFVKKPDIQSFFGTTKVKIAYVNRTNGLTIFYIDYSLETPALVQLVKPAGKESWNCECPLISPDGNWVTYNLYSSKQAIESYMQKLSPTSQPVSITSNGAEPHWWVNNKTNYYIIFSRTGDINSTYYTAGDLSDDKIAASAGSTYMQKLTGDPGDVPFFLGLRVDETSPAVKIASLPYKGGLSDNGLFICTGYEQTFMLRFFTR
jgi:hypothetical protein